MIKPTDVTPRIVQALAYLRVHAEVDARDAVERAVRILDEAGVFAEIDEAVDGRKIPELLAEGAARDLAEAHGARDHEIRTPLDYVRAVNDAQGELDAGDRAAMGRLARRAFRLNNPGA